jgi:hypothetical protein
MITQSGRIGEVKWCFSEVCVAMVYFSSTVEAQEHVLSQALTERVLGYF